MSASLHNPHPQKLPEKLGKIPTPAHLYSSEALTADASLLLRVFQQKLSNSSLHFSVKTCPLPRLLRDLARSGWGFEVVSEADLMLAVRARAARRTVVASPLFPREDHLRNLLQNPLIKAIHLESIEAARIVGAILRRHPKLKARAPMIGLRVHSRNGHFGIASNATALNAALRPLLDAGSPVQSLQIHSSSEGGTPSTEKFGHWFSDHLPLLIEAKRIVESQQGSPVEHLDFGGGLEHPSTWRVPLDLLGEYHSGRIPPAAHAPKPTLHELASAAVSGLRAKLEEQSLARMPISFELGRAVCSSALSTLLTIGSVKDDLYPGALVLLTDGNTSILGPMHRVILPFEHFSTNQPTATAQRCFLYGNLPHASDWIYQNVALHGPGAGDRILIRHTGAYFLSQEARFGHPLPGVFCRATGKTIRKPESIKQMFLRDKF